MAEMNNHNKEGPKMAAFKARIVHKDMLHNSIKLVFASELNDASEKHPDIAGNISKITDVVSSAVRSSVIRILSCVLTDDHQCEKYFRIFGEDVSKIEAFSEAVDTAFREFFFARDGIYLEFKKELSSCLKESFDKAGIDMVVGQFSDNIDDLVDTNIQQENMLINSVKSIFIGELNDAAIDVFEEHPRSKIAGNISEITNVVSSAIRSSITRVLSCAYTYDYQCEKNFRIFGEDVSRMKAFSEAFSTAFWKIFLTHNSIYFEFKKTLRSRLKESFEKAGIDMVSNIYLDKISDLYYR